LIVHLDLKLQRAAKIRGPFALVMTLRMIVGAKRVEKRKT